MDFTSAEKPVRVENDNIIMILLRNRVDDVKILWLGDSDSNDINKVGAKAATLSRLSASEHRVPPGFCITVDALSHWVEPVNSSPTTASTQFFPIDTYRALVSAYSRLAAHCGTPNPSGLSPVI
jgi:hypothetical protein